MISKKLTISLGKLAIPLEKFAKTKKQTRSEVARMAIAKFLEIDCPLVELGNPDWIARRGKKEQ